MSDSCGSPKAPSWPARLQRLVADLPTCPSPEGRNALRSDLWMVLNAALRRYLRLHLSRGWRADLDDLADIAAQKSLDLLAQIESGRWVAEGRGEQEIAGFVSAAARHGLADHLRREVRLVRDQGSDQETGEQVRTGRVSQLPDGGPSAEVCVERHAFASALYECLQALPARSRLLWFFRVFLEMTTKEIAAHPEVDVRVGHIDVLLQRARDSVRTCMEGKGHHPEEIPPGTLTELWRRLRQVPDLAAVTTTRDLPRRGTTP